MENEDKKIEIHFHKEKEEVNDSFISKHAPALLTFLGVIITASLGTATVWFKPNDAPEAKIRSTKQLEGEVQAGTKLLLYGHESNDPDGTISDLEFRWGVAGINKAFKSGCGRENRFAEWTTDKPGRYTIYLDVTDKCGKGKRNTASIDVIIGAVATKNAPRILLNDFSKNGMTPFKTALDASGSLSDNKESLRYTWSINDKNVSTKEKYVFLATDPGRYKIDLLVKDNIGEEQKTFFINVDESEPIKQEELLNINSKEEGIIDATSQNVYVLPKRIITNGYPLKISANKIRAIGSKIISFTNGVAKNGSNGAYGVNGAYQGPEQAGADGQHGAPGEKGNDGRNSGNIKINASLLVGNIEVFNFGEDGGNGGDGGKGGNGGQGGQGRPAKSGILDCRSGPGRGGSGGNGGNGGNGGSGGNGGDAGIVNLEITSLDDNSSVVVNTRGGNQGLPGDSGRPGAGGKGGREGQLVAFCGSANRHGAAGKPGSPGAEADTGKSGNPSKIILKTDSQSFEAIKSLTYPKK